MTYARPAEVEVEEDFFSRIEAKEIFCRKFKRHAACFGRQYGYEPAPNEPRLICAWQGYVRDKKHARKSMPQSSKGPDHFKLAGILTFWLRRFAPVYVLRDLSMSVDEKYGKVQSLLKKYPSELIILDLGITVCDFFVNQREKPAGRPDISLDYYEDFCYIMQWKNISPHAMGLVFRSLFTPLKPMPADDAAPGV